MENTTFTSQSPPKSWRLLVYNNLACRAPNLFEEPQNSGNLREAQRFKQQPVVFVINFHLRHKYFAESLYFHFLPADPSWDAVRPSPIQTGLRKEFSSAEGGLVSVEVTDGRNEFF